MLADTIIPLPIVKAQEALKSAESLAEKKDRTKEDNDQLRASMDQARAQLEFGQALGYGTKKDFDRRILPKSSTPFTDLGVLTICPQNIHGPRQASFSRSVSFFASSSRILRRIALSSIGWGAAVRFLIALKSLAMAIIPFLNLTTGTD